MAIAVFGIAALVLAGCEKYNYGDQNQSQNQERNQEQQNGKKGNPPAEMSSACDGKSEGDSCEIAMPGKDGEEDSENTMTGTCQKSSQGEDQLVCRPDNMPENGGGPQGGNMPGSGRQGQGGAQPE